MMYGVFDNDNPASSANLKYLSNKCWQTHLFDTFEEAKTYANKWLGDFAGGELILNVPIDYSGFGDKIEIKEIL
jgi:hypothetical protein